MQHLVTTKDKSIDSLLPFLKLEQIEPTAVANIHSLGLGVEEALQALALIGAVAVLRATLISPRGL
jgi:hypothetical protein